MSWKTLSLHHVPGKPRLMLTFVNTLLCLVIPHYKYSSNWNPKWLENRSNPGFEEVLLFYARKLYILLTEPITSIIERIILPKQI